LLLGDLMEGGRDVMEGGMVFERGRCDGRRQGV
jgi:hypothetical protein